MYGTTQTEMNEIIEQLPKLNLNQLDFSEQITLATAMIEFSEKIKPIIARHLSEMPETSNFLMKL